MGGGDTYVHRIMHKFMAWAQSPLGKECFDFNDPTNPPYRRRPSLLRSASAPSSRSPGGDGGDGGGGGGGRVVANDAFAISVKVSVINADARYSATASFEDDEDDDDDDDDDDDA
jgi:hypothetical protein